MQAEGRMHARYAETASLNSSNLGGGELLVCQISVASEHESLELGGIFVP
jgi:hypothetical protein